MQSSNLGSHLSRGKSPTGHHGLVSTGSSRSYSLTSSTTSRSILVNEPTQKNYGRTILAAVGLFMISLIAVPLYSNSATMADQSAVARIEGGLVNVLRADSSDIERHDDGAQVDIQVNDMVSAESGTAIVQFFGDQLVSLYPSSRLTVERYEVNSLGKRLEYMVWGGHIQHESRQSAGASDWIQISTPSSTASIRNAVVAVHVVSPNQTFYRVQSGIAWITMGDDEIFLAPNEQLVAIVAQPLTKQPINQLTANFNSGVNSGAIGSSASDTGSTTVAQQWPANKAKTIGDLLSNSQQQAAGQGALLDSKERFYIVQLGDSFWTIAIEHAISIDALTAANREIAEQPNLLVGQTMRIPMNSN